MQRRQIWAFKCDIHCIPFHSILFFFPIYFIFLDRFFIHVFYFRSSLSHLFPPIKLQYLSPDVLS